MREIHIDMILNVPNTIVAEDIQDQFVRWMESKDYFGGGSVEDISDKIYPPFGITEVLPEGIFNFIIARHWVPAGGGSDSDGGQAIGYITNSRVYEGTKERAVEMLEAVQTASGNLEWEIYPIVTVLEGRSYKLITRKT